MTERESFEAWMRDTHGPGVNLVRSDDGYVSTVPHRAVRMTYASVQMLWEAWNRRAQPAQAVPLLSDDEIDAIQRQTNAAYYAGTLKDRDHSRAVEAAVRAKLGAGVPPPEDWSVFNSGAEVASGLTWAEALEYITPERVARGWNAVCVADLGNLRGIVGKEGGNEN